MSDAAGHRIFETMEMAASALGLPYDTLKAAKAAGCPAFRNTRVYEDKLLEWLAKNKEKVKPNRDTLTAVKMRVAREQERKLRIANDAKERKLISRDEIVKAFHSAAHSAKSMLRQKLENEYPALIVGQDIASARIYGKRIVDAVCEEMQKIGKVFE